MTLYDMNSLALSNRKLFDFNLKISSNSKKFLNDYNYMIDIKTLKEQ